MATEHAAPPLLRPPQSGEWPALSALCLRSKGHWGHDAAFLAACRDELTMHPDQLASSMIRVAEQGGTPAGLVQITRGADPADLLKLFVDPPFIGRGIGAGLLAWACGRARAQGCTALCIGSDPGAVAFYLSQGARQVGTTASGSIPGRMLPRLVIEL